MDKELTISEIFIMFLKNYRKYTSWQHQSNVTVKELFESSSSNKPSLQVDYWIEDSFYWMDTKEGFDYWHDMDKKWKKLCKDFNLRIK